MPTPTGLPKTGEILIHKPSGQRMRVVKREGNDVLFSVILTPADGSKLPNLSNQVFGMPNCFRLLEAGYWLGPSGTYKFEEE